MQTLEKINTYVGLVCEQIQWKKAHSRIVEEMKNHIIDQRDSFMTQGLDEEAATEKAIADTGDARAIGTQLDRIHRPKPQWGMLGATAALVVIGLLIRLFVFNNAVMPELLSVRLLFSAIGIVVMLAAYFSDFSLIGKYPKTVYCSIVTLSIAFLCFSPVVAGRPFYLQYIILLFPLALSTIVFAMRSKGYGGIILCGLAFALPAFIAVYVSSITGCLLFTVAGIVLLSVAIHREWFGVKKLHGFLLMFIPILFVISTFFMSMNGYRWNRLAIALSPLLEPNGAGYMSIMTREILSGAKLFGMGNIPEQYSVMFSELAVLFQTDLMLTAIIVMLGWALFMAILGVLLFFIIKGFLLCFKQKSGLGLFVSLAIMMTFTIQVVGYVAFNLGFQFLSPLSLPLISRGNTAMVINMGLIGIMLSVFRTGGIVRDDKTPLKNSKLFSWKDGKLTVDFKIHNSF